MIDIRPALVRLGISDTSAVHAVQQVREFIEGDGEKNRFQRTNEFLDKVLGVSLAHADVDGRPVGDEHDYAVTIAQAAIEGALKSEGVVDDVDTLMTNAKLRADKFITNPYYKWCFAKEAAVVTSSNNVAVAAGIETKVAIKADGTIKKGGKEVLAIELYKKHVTEAAVPVDNQGFIKILMEQLGMTKAGATTYAWNMRKRFNPDQIKHKPVK